MPVTVEFYKIWKREKIKKRIIMHKHAHKTTYLDILLYMNTCNQKDTLSLPYNPPSPKNMNTHNCHLHTKQPYFLSSFSSKYCR